MRPTAFAAALICLLNGFFPPSAAWAASGRIAMVQYNADLHFNRYDENRAALTKFAEEAVANHADLIVFPEGSSYGYADATHFWCGAGQTHAKCVPVEIAAEKIPGGRTEVYWSDFAKSHEVYVLFNLPESGDDGKFYNTTGVAGPGGYLTKYRKRELYMTDQYYASPGRAPTILNTPFGKLGIAICMDGTYPGPLEEYRHLGVDAVLLPMDWDQDPESSSSAKNWFSERAREAGVDLFASDVSSWDGSGKYAKDGSGRTRDGLPAEAVGQDGITYSVLTTGNF